MRGSAGGKQEVEFGGAPNKLLAVSCSAKSWSISRDAVNEHTTSTTVAVALCGAAFSLLCYFVIIATPN